MASTITSPSTTAPHLLSSLHNNEPQVISKSSAPAQKATHDVVAEFHYYKDPGDGSEPAPNIAGQVQTYDRPVDTRLKLVHDIRGEEDQYSLDKTGFEIYKHASQEKDFVDEEQIKSKYYAETEELLKKATGATRILIFDHTIRRQTADDRSNQSAGGSPAVSLRGPVQRVHIDQSYSAATDRVHHHLPDEASTLLQSRYQIINVWRPIKPIFKDPLGVADANSVPDSDLVGVKLVYPNRVGETYTVKPGEGHKWYYLYGQREDEVMLIKCFDSLTDGRARRVPHSAFKNPETEGEAPRESIEVRALVFY